MNRRATRWVAWVEPIKPPPDKPVATSGNLGQGENNLQRGEIKLRSQAITTIIFEVPFYNRRRPHQALGGRTPMSIWREGVTGALGARAADMMDNAFALTACPQKQQQTRPLAA